MKTILANVDRQNFRVSTILHSKKHHIQICNLDLLSYETLGPSPDEFLKIEEAELIRFLKMATTSVARLPRLLPARRY